MRTYYRRLVLKGWVMHKGVAKGTRFRLFIGSLLWALTPLFATVLALLVGAIAATTVALSLPQWPGWAIIPLCLTVGFLAGAIWGGIAGALKAYLNVNEILSTIMLNMIAVQGMNFLLRNPPMDPMQVEAGSFISQTARFPLTTDLPCLIPTRLHAGSALAVLLAILVCVFLWCTTIVIASDRLENLYDHIPIPLARHCH